MRFFLLLSAALTLFWGCSSQIDLEQEKQALMETDRQFSHLSSEQGVVPAFHFYMANDGLALPFNGEPSSKEDYAKALQTMRNGNTPPDGRLTWSPDFADVSVGGDLGYTWGQYTYTFFDSTKAPSRGYYVTIWKKQRNGAWRFVFDAGNQLLSAEEK